ncbi:von Willebrand factor type A domain protein [Asticcacaulis biprosthecium C19]|uniref:von Willebrand factor type A domain protein n=1 Tax=Asticcacaulis biprosthecium C19 TaxID=715226 RepID=F4QND6_9CAUL|nr:VWA domain-containing protein [Asticcacaulis biprosthecium]EGF90844.1 von Willebrand factor type A domain protein [Asticcacaulis biprosthecium C19]
MRGMLLAGAAAMVVGASAPVPVAMATTPVLNEASPVKCQAGNPGQEYYYTSSGLPGGFSASPPQSAPSFIAPPPPPPPPPAPAPVSQSPAATSDAVVVTGNRPALQSSVQMKRSAAPAYEAREAPNTEKYNGESVSSVMRVTETPVSTFSVDVDTGAYANVRRMLNDGTTPTEAAVRTEELLNYFRYDYPLPQDRSKPFSITTDVAQTPWNAQTRLMRVGLRAYDVPRSERPAANLVFLVDVSGSMNDPDKLPLVKTALSMLSDNLRPDDKVSIVVYAGAAGMVLAPTHEGKYVKQALECLSAGGSTAGGQGMALAYATAEANFIKGGINRVILATDGDFNVGISSIGEVEALVKQNRESGVTLTALGFGTGNYNEALMEKMADVGNGNYAYIDSAMEARKVLDDELSSTLFTVAKDVKIQVEFNPALVSQYRLIGYENRALAEEDFNNDKVDAGDIGAGHQVTAIYEIVPTGAKGWLPDRHFTANNAKTSSQGEQLVWLKLRYKLPGENTSRLIERAIPASSVANAQPARGDMAFAVSVAAYGQILRGDTYLGGYGLGDARALAGTQSDYRRQEFLELTRLAETAKVRQ